MSDNIDPRFQQGKTTIIFQGADGTIHEASQPGSSWKTEQALRHEVTSQGGVVISVTRVDPDTPQS